MDYQVIRTNRRTLSLEITHEGQLRVRSPQHLSTSYIEKYITEKISWIKKHQSLIANQHINTTNDEESYILFGNRYPSKERSIIDIQAEQKQALTSYVRERIYILTSILPLKQHPKKINITHAQKRWGSCSNRGSLSFSQRLIFYPKTAIDAVIIHELAHINEANHSARFWDLVYTWMPEYDEHIQALDWRK